MHSKKFKNSQFIISLSINQQNNAVYEKYCYMQYKKAELFSQVNEHLAAAARMPDPVGSFPFGCIHFRHAAPPRISG